MGLIVDRAADGDSSSGWSAEPGARRGEGRVTMGMLIGTSDGVFMTDGSGKPQPVEGLAGHEVRALKASNGSIFAGAENGVYLSKNGGRSWKLSGVEGKIIWDIAAAPGDERTIYVGAQSAALYRSQDGGE